MALPTELNGELATTGVEPIRIMVGQVQCKGSCVAIERSGVSSPTYVEIFQDVL